MVENNYTHALGAGGSEVRILSLRPFKIMGYGLGRSPPLCLFFLLAEKFF